MQPARGVLNGHCCNQTLPAQVNAHVYMLSVIVSYAAGTEVEGGPRQAIARLRNLPCVATSSTAYTQVNRRWCEEGANFTCNEVTWGR